MVMLEKFPRVTRRIAVVDSRTAGSAAECGSAEFSRCADRGTAREKFAIEMADEFWKTFPQTRFHDYAQQSIRIPVQALPVSRWVSDGDVVEWRGLQLKCLETPGYTRGSVTWLLEHDGRKIAFTGDLIYGDGRIPDLFSFQDASTKLRFVATMVSVRGWQTSWRVSAGSKRRI